MGSAETSHPKICKFAAHSMQFHNCVHLVQHSSDTQVTSFAATAMTMTTTTIMTTMLALVPADGCYQPIARQVTEPQSS